MTTPETYDLGYDTETPEIEFSNGEDETSQFLGLQYVHSWAGGLQWLRTPKSRTTLANFRPTLIKCIEMRGTEETSYEYDIRLELTKTVFKDVRIAGSDLKSSRALQEKLAPIIHGEFVVYPSGWSHLWPALLELANTQGYPTEVTYKFMGWAEVEPESWCYFLPGADAGITSVGLDARYRMDASSLSQNLMRYGTGVRPMNPEERVPVAATLVDFFKLHPASVPITVQVLAGALSSWGIRSIPPLLHIHGESGAFKTTLAVLGLSLIGKFDSRHGGGAGNIPENWSSTQNSIMKQLHSAKDITLLIDDYKSMRGEPTMVVQSYSDSTTRNRLTSDQKQQESLVPLGLLLSTGEDAWESYESTQARTLAFSIPSLVKKPAELKAFTEKLGAIQDQAVDNFPLIGGSWAKWLATIGPEPIRKAIEKQLADHRKRISEQGTMHMRLASIMAMMLTAGDLVDLFLKDELPAARETYRAVAKEAWALLLQETAERAEDAAGLAPYTWMVSEIQQAIQQNEVHFTHRKMRGGPPLGAQHTQSIGFFDEDNLFLTKQSTFAWAEQRAARRHKSLHFSWSAFCQATREELGPFMHNGKDERISYSLHSNHTFVRAVVLSRTIVANSLQAEEPPTDTNPQDLLQHPATNDPFIDFINS